MEVFAFNFRQTDYFTIIGPGLVSYKLRHGISYIYPMKKSLALLPILFLYLASYANTLDLRKGMIIRESATITRNTYNVNADTSIRKPLIIIDGNNITIDFNQAVIQGSNDKTNPDEFYGLSILIKKGCRNITLKNVFIHGFKIGIMADGVAGLTIDNCDLSYNWRQRLLSTREKENEEDWMSYHHNENDEWLRYGAAIYLKNCTKSIITNNAVTGGQCALMMTRCEKSEIRDNNFSFNSGIGIGLYRSTYNKIYHNRLDYNVRGYSFGKYKRGQDSAAILLFEQSSNNMIAFNTATHSGDGFFLWAGQTTMDTGEGGCNDNLIYGNDFSYAPTNGIEVTFSRNQIIKNILKECDHGIWGGYSYDSDITDNHFENNRIGIAIEHGQNMNIALNEFIGDTTGIKLWSRKQQPEDWIYAKKRNTDSRNYWIAANKLSGNNIAFDIMGTDTVVLSGNIRSMVNQTLKLGERTTNIDTENQDAIPDIEYQKDSSLNSISADRLPESIVPEQKEQMRITEWGPYDFRYPLVWLKDIDSNGLYHFEILGPNGNWRILKSIGFTIVKNEAGKLPSDLWAKPDLSIAGRRLQLEFVGSSFTDRFGKKNNTGVSLFDYLENNLATPLK